ncbi:MAG TPA: hypothetical protein VF245_05920 [Solirubrobacterales bacterium]
MAVAAFMLAALLIGSSAVASASGTKQACLSKLLQPPHEIRSVMYKPGRRPEVITKASYSDVEGCDSWQRQGKYRVQIKNSGHWADLEGDYWYPVDGDIADKNKAYKIAMGAFATRDVFEHCVNGRWEPARVRFVNFVTSATTGKVVARGKIKSHPIKIEPSAHC